RLALRRRAFVGGLAVPVRRIRLDGRRRRRVTTGGTRAAMNGHARPSRAVLAGAIVAFFAFRLLYGLSSDLFFEDETQIYLMGLRYYATGAWPHFGPDVVWTKSEIPGALQSLLIGIPFKLAPYPEAPYVLLNLLSLAALAAFAWYITVH